MTKTDVEHLIVNLADDLTTHCGFSTPAYRTRFYERTKVEIRKALGRYDSYRPDISDLLEQNGRMRAALETIAEGSTDKLKGLQAKNALDNIGPKITCNG